MYTLIFNKPQFSINYCIVKDYAYAQGFLTKTCCISNMKSAVFNYLLI